MSIDVAAQQRPTLSERVAEEIRVAMVRRGTNGTRLARALGVSPAWISYRLTGTQPIDLNDLERIAGALGVEIVDLLPRAATEVARTLGYAEIHDHDRSPAIAVHDRRTVSRPPDNRPRTRPGRGPSASPTRTGRVTR